MTRVLNDNAWSRLPCLIRLLWIWFDKTKVLFPLNMLIGSPPMLLLTQSSSTMMTRRRFLLRWAYCLTLGLVAVSVVVPSYHRWMARYTPDRTFFVTQPQQVRPPSRPLPPPPQIVWLLSFPNSVRIRGCYTDACFANYWSASCSPSNNPL